MTREEMEVLRVDLTYTQDWAPKTHHLVSTMFTEYAAQRQTIEQLEGQVKALEGALEKVLALKNILERAYRGYGTPEEERQKAALAATGEEGKP